MFIAECILFLLLSLYLYLLNNIYILIRIKTIPKLIHIIPFNFYLFAILLFPIYNQELIAQTVTILLLRVVSISTSNHSFVIPTDWFATGYKLILVDENLLIIIAINHELFFPIKYSILDLHLVMIFFV